MTNCLLLAKHKENTKGYNRLAFLNKQELYWHFYSKKVKFQPRKREIADDVPNIEDLGTANGALSTQLPISTFSYLIFLAKTLNMISLFPNSIILR